MPQQQNASSSTTAKSQKRDEAMGTFLEESRHAFVNILLNSYLTGMPLSKLQLSSIIVRNPDDGVIGFILAPSNNVIHTKTDKGVKFDFKRANGPTTKAIQELARDIQKVCNDHKLQLTLSPLRNGTMFSLLTKSADEMMKLLKHFCEDFDIMTLDHHVDRLILRKGQTLENLTARFLEEGMRKSPTEREMANPFVPDPMALTALPAQTYLSAPHAYVSAIRGADRGIHEFPLEKVELALMKVKGLEPPAGLGLKMVH